MMVLDEVVSGATGAGASAGVILGLAGIKKLIEKFKDRKIAFVQDKETLNKVKEDLKSNELKFYKSYIKEGNIISPMIMGLTLRRLEEEKDLERIDNLRGKILSKYDTDGVHLAYAVQSGIVSRYIAFLLEIHASEKVMEKRLSNFLINIDNYVYFVNSQYFELEKDKRRVLLKIEASSPDVFVISGMGSALKNAEELIKEIDKLDLKEYYREDYSKKNRRIAFFHKSLSKI